MTTASTTTRPLLAAAVTLTVLLWGSAFVGIRATLPTLGYANLASGRLRPPPAGRRDVRRARPPARGSPAQPLAAAAPGSARRDRLRRLSAAAQRRRADRPGRHQRLQKRALATMAAVDVTAWATWLGAGLALPFASGLPRAVTTAPASDVVTLLLLGIIVTTVPFLLWTWTLARVKATTAAPFLLLVSPAALGVAWLWLGEAPVLAALAGGALTLAGVATMQTGARTSRPALGARLG